MSSLAFINPFHNKNNYEITKTSEKNILSGSSSPQNTQRTNSIIAFIEIFTTPLKRALGYRMGRHFVVHLSPPAIATAQGNLVKLIKIRILHYPHKPGLPHKRKMQTVTLYNNL